MLISPEYDDLNDTLPPCLRIGADSLRKCRMKGSLAFGGSTAIHGGGLENAAKDEVVLPESGSSRPRSETRM